MVFRRVDVPIAPGSDRDAPPPLQLALVQLRPGDERVDLDAGRLMESGSSTSCDNRSTQCVAIGVELVAQCAQERTRLRVSHRDQNVCVNRRAGLTCERARERASHAIAHAGGFERSNDLGRHLEQIRHGSRTASSGYTRRARSLPSVRAANRTTSSRSEATGYRARRPASARARAGRVGAGDNFRDFDGRQAAPDLDLPVAQSRDRCRGSAQRGVRGRPKPRRSLSIRRAGPRVDGPGRSPRLRETRQSLSAHARSARRWRHRGG